MRAYSKGGFFQKQKIYIYKIANIKNQYLKPEATKIKSSFVYNNNNNSYIQHIYQASSVLVLIVTIVKTKKKKIYPDSNDRHNYY